MSKSQTLAERLTTLLAERKSLRVLLARYQHGLETRTFNEQRTDLEHQIATLVTERLPFDERERRYHLPSACHIAECAYRMRLRFANPQVADAPSSVWDSGSLVLGVMTSGWHPLVKERLLDLSGPLDDTIARMLTE